MIWKPLKNPGKHEGITMSGMIFQYQQKQLRIVRVDENGTFWVVAKDPCDILGIGNVSMALSALDEDEKGISEVDTPGGPQKMAIISEAGQPGYSKLTGLDIVESLGLMDQFYAICVEMFGNHSRPLPPIDPTGIDPKQLM